jgi:hypothetical protein
MCPVCTVTVIAGLGLSRLLGIDDLITSIWIGGFILSFSFITINWIVKKWPKLKSKYYYFPTFILMYLFVLVPLKLDHIIGIYSNTIFGIDKVVFGILVGSIVFLIGVWMDKYQRRKFSKIFFPFQKVIFPVVALLIASLVFFFLTR